jgi:hypothetical protein
MMHKVLGGFLASGVRFVSASHFLVLGLGSGKHAGMCQLIPAGVGQAQAIRFGNQILRCTLIQWSLYPVLFDTAWYLSCCSIACTAGARWQVVCMIIHGHVGDVACATDPCICRGLFCLLTLHTLRCARSSVPRQWWCGPKVPRQPKAKKNRPKAARMCWGAEWMNSCRSCCGMRWYSRWGKKPSILQ